MTRWLLGLLSYRIVYFSHWGVRDHRYDAEDLNMQRPIHLDMGCAPPWAKMKITKALTPPAPGSEAKS